MLAKVLYLNLHLTFTFYMLSFISYMAGEESPGERTGDFSLLEQANNIFLEKETCKLKVVGKQLVTLYKLLIQDLTQLQI